MNKYLAASLFLLIAIMIPQVTLAAWWNPLTWFQSEHVMPVVETTENAVVESPSTSTQATVTPAPTAPTSNSESVIEKLRSEINQLNQQNTSLQGQLANAQSKYQQCVSQSSTSSSTTNDSEASKLRVELQVLDQVDEQIDTYQNDDKTDDLLKLLNDAKMLDGSPLFPVPAKSVTSYWNEVNLGTVSIEDIHTLVDHYRTTVKIDLAKYEDVP